MPEAVEIETDARCNRACAYCPVSIADKRTGQMSEETYKKIIEELKEWGFRGRLSYHFYNEPMMDKRLPSFIAYSRKELKKATLVLFTNGDYLTAENIPELFHLELDRIHISLHNEKIQERIKKLLPALPKNLLKKIDVKSYFNAEEPMSNRGGLINIQEDNFKLIDYNPGCYMIAFMVVNWEGKVVLCCNDFHAKHVLGKVESRPIRQIWQNSSKLRRQIYLGKYTLDICKDCNIPASG